MYVRFLFLFYFSCRLKTHSGRPGILITPCPSYFFLQTQITSFIIPHAMFSPTHKQAFPLFNREKVVRGGNRGEKGTNTDKKIKTVFNLQLTTFQQSENKYF